VSGENGQIVLRYTPLPEGVSTRTLPELGEDVRTGKNAVWLLEDEAGVWQDRLLTVLQELVKK
jgi:hypothetical protein